MCQVQCVMRLMGIASHASQVVVYLSGSAGELGLALGVQLTNKRKKPGHLCRWPAHFTEPVISANANVGEKRSAPPCTDSLVP